MTGRSARHALAEAVPAPLPPELVAALLRALRMKNRPTVAALVEYMASRPDAPMQEIAEHALDDPGASRFALSKLVGRANRSLEALAAPFRFKTGSGFLFRCPHDVHAMSTPCPQRPVRSVRGGSRSPGGGRPR